MVTEKVGILLIEGYPLIPFSCVLEVLRTANRLSNSDLFEWQFYARNTKEKDDSLIISPYLDDPNELKVILAAMKLDSNKNLQSKSISKSLLIYKLLSLAW